MIDADHSFSVLGWLLFDKQMLCCCRLYSLLIDQSGIDADGHWVLLFLQFQVTFPLNYWTHSTWYNFAVAFTQTY